jgi:hypothetical protein
MDKFLESRYWALFWDYEPTVKLVGESLRRRISLDLRGDGRLRADAAYFLLLYFDQMIAHPEVEEYSRDDQGPFQRAIFTLTKQSSFARIEPSKPDHFR